MNLRSKVVRLLESGNHPVIYIITVKTYYAILMSGLQSSMGKTAVSIVNNNAFQEYV